MHRIDHGSISSRVSLLTLFLLLLISLPVVAEGLRPGLRLIGMDAQNLRYAPQLHTEVNIGVSGMLARVNVVQRFSNPSSEWVEGIYVFPLPAASAGSGKT